MLEDLGAIQSRIREIQARIAALRPSAAEAPPTVNGPGTSGAAFDATLQRARDSGTPATTARAGAQPSGVYVPPASLGPLPPMPVAPGVPVSLTSPLAPGQTDTGQTGTGQYAGLIQTYAAKHGLDPNLVRAVIQTESGGNPHVVSPAGAMGLMQLMPANVREAGISDGLDPEQNIAAGTQQLSDLLKEYGGDLDLALAGYNAGPGNVRKYGGVPPFRETQNYIRKVRAAMGQGGE